MNKFFIIIFFSFSIINISAQTENSENNSQEEVLYYDLDIDEDEVIAAPNSTSKTSPSPASKNFLKQGNNKKLYTIDPLYKGFDWIKTKKERDVGVIKDGKIFLPLVFFAETNQKGPQIILSYKRQQGVYDLDLDKWIIPTVSDWIVKINSDLFAVRMLDGFFRLVNSKNEILEKTNWVRFDKSSINSNHYIIKTRGNLYGLYNKKLKQVIFEPIHNSFKIERGHYSISKNGVGKNLLNSDGTFLFENWVDNIKKVVDPNTGKRPRNLYGLEKDFDYYIVKKGKSTGLVRSDSKIIIPYKYKDIAFRGYFWSQNEVGKWGVINNGKIVIPFKYDEFFQLRHSNVRKGNVVIFFNLLKVRIGNNFGLYEYNSDTLNLLAECKYKSLNINPSGVIIQYSDNKFQLINYATKRPVFKTRKNEIIQSYQNSLIVKHKNNWTLVNSEGVNRTKQIYKSLQNFHFNIIAKNTSGKFGILTNKGKTILPFEYENVFSLDEDKSVANIFVIKKGGKFGLFDAYQKQIKTEIIYNNIFKDGQYFYLFNGDDFFETRAHQVNLQQREKYIPTKKEIGLDKDLFIIEFTPRYESIFGLYDFKKNDWILPLGYKYIFKIKEDLFLVKKNNETAAFVNSKGKIIRKTDWIHLDQAKLIKDKINHFYIKNINGLSGIYDVRNAKEIFPSTYDKISVDNNVQGHYLLKKEGKSNYADYEGKLMFVDDLENLKKISNSNNPQHFTFTKNGKRGVINSDGKIIISQDYNNLKVISNIFWLQNSEKKWGFVNEKNEQVSFDFDEVKSVKWNKTQHFFQVKKGDKLGVLVKEKDSVTQFFDYKYESIEFFHDQIITGTTSGYRLLDYSKKDLFGKEFQEIRKFYKSFFVKYDNQWFFVDSKGKKIIDENFNDLDNFLKGNSTNIDKNTYAKYKATNQKFGLINALGQKLTEPIFDDIVYRLSGGYIMVKNGEKLRWYNAFKHEYVSDIEFDSFYETPKKVYCLSKDKWYYTGNFYDKFYFKELKLPTSKKY